MSEPPGSAPREGAETLRGIVKIEYLADRMEFLAALVEMQRDEWGHLRPNETLFARTARIRGRCRRRRVPTVLVASRDGKLLGGAMLVEHDMETRPQWSPWLAGVVVAPEHRGRGIGALLVERVVSESRALGYTKLHLYTFSTEEYYARLGWQFVEHATYLGEDVTVMSLALG